MTNEIGCEHVLVAFSSSRAMFVVPVTAQFRLRSDEVWQISRHLLVFQLADQANTIRNMLV